MPFNAGRSLVDVLSGFIPGLSAIANHQRQSEQTKLNMDDLMRPQQSPVSAMPQQSPQQPMQPPQMSSAAPPTSLMGAPGGTPQMPPALGQMLQAIMASKVGPGGGPPNMQMLQGGGSPPRAPVPGGSPSQPGAPQAMGSAMGGGPQPAAQPPMAPQQQQQQERDPNLSAVAQPTGQGVIADGNANLRAIVTSLRATNPKASPEAILGATMQRIQMLKGVQPEVKDAMMMQARSAQTEFKYTQLQEQMDRKDSALAEKQRNDDMVNKAKEDAITAAGLRIQMGINGKYEVTRMQQAGATGRTAMQQRGATARTGLQQSGQDNRQRYGEGQKNARAAAGEQGRTDRAAAGEQGKTDRAGMRPGSRPAPARSAAGNMPRPKSKKEALALKPGTKFVDPSGNVQTRP